MTRTPEYTMALIATPRPLCTICVVAALAGCGPKKSSSPEATGAAAPPEVAPAVMAPSPPPTPPSPLSLVTSIPAGAPELPPLSGATTDLDMVTLTHSTQTFTIEADTSMFNATDPRVAGRLQLAFQFDPRWRVGLWEGQRVAWSRLADAAGHSAPWGGYRTLDGYTIRTMFRFEKRADDHPWSASGLVARNAAGARSMQVVSWKVDRGAWEGQLAAAFTIDGAGMSLEVHEIAPQLTLSGTQRDLQQATLRTKAIADQVARGHLQRTSLAMVPKGEPRLGNPFVKVNAVDSGLDIRGRVHVPSPGWAWVRVLDASGTAWQESHVSLATAERLGWDSNPDVVSYFQSVVPAAASAPGSGTIEVWFDPDDTHAIVKLGEFPFGAGTPPAG